MDKGLVLPHEYGARLDNVTHLCPNCGGATVFCRTCFGAGEVTEEQLAAWQQEADAVMEGRA